MEKKKPQCHHPVCTLSHELFNKLSIIVSSCDLLEEQEDPAHDGGRHLTRIRDAARNDRKTQRTSVSPRAPPGKDTPQKEHVKHLIPGLRCPPRRVTVVQTNPTADLSADAEHLPYF